MRTLSLFCVSLAVLYVGIARSDVLEVSVPALEGSYVLGPGRTATFDLGGRVDSVRNVVLRCSGMAAPGESCVGGDMCEPGCHAQRCDLFALIDSETGFRYASLPNLGSFFTAADTFSVFPGSRWDSVLDGTGTLRLELGGIVGIPECNIQTTRSPVATVTSVTLIFDVVRTDTPVHRKTWGQLKARYR